MSGGGMFAKILKGNEIVCSHEDDDDVLSSSRDH